MKRKLSSCLAPVLALFCISLVATRINGQSASAPFVFRSGQSMCHSRLSAIATAGRGGSSAGNPCHF